MEFVEGKPSWLTPFIHFKIFGIKPIYSIFIRIPFLCDKFLKVDWKVTERVVENNWLYRFLDKLPEQARILDVGCVGSMVSFELANMGYKVTGIDLRGYPLLHPNFSFVKGDICRMPFPDGSFDFITAISTIEHVGFPFYDLPAFPEGDKKVIREIYRCLKYEGLFYMTVPFGLKENTWYQIFDSRHLTGLLQDFNIIEEKYYRRSLGKFWLPVTAQELEKVSPYSSQGVNGVAILLCKKRS